MMVKYKLLIKDNEEEKGKCCWHLLRETTPVLRLLFTFTANGCKKFKMHKYKYSGSFTKQLCFLVIVEVMFWVFHLDLGFMDSMWGFDYSTATLS